MLADDVEEADDFKPVVAATGAGNVVSTKAAAPVTKEAPSKVATSAPPKSQDERRNSGRSGYRGRGGRGGRGRGRGGRGRGGRSFNRDRERERDPDGWERPPRPAATPTAPANASATPAPQPGTNEANGNGNPAAAPADESEPKTEANCDASTEAQPEAKAVAVEEKSMGLAEYLAQKKTAAAGVGLKRGDAPTRKASEFGGKMAPLRKQNDTAETSIFSAVAMKSETESRAAAAAGGATNPANVKDEATQQFFRSQPRRGRGRGGYRGDDRHGPGNSYGRRPGPNAPNVDDTNAFPALSA